MKRSRLTPYLLSLPERVLRSAAALAGGLVRELSAVTLPAGFRRTRLYQTMVEATLRFLVERVGDVKDAYPREGAPAADFLTRRAAGNGIELLGLVAFRASPVWVMAALADLSGAGRQLIQEISGSLKEEGLLDRQASFENVDQILDGLEKSAGRLAENINTPPLDVAGLRQEWKALRQDLKSIPLRRRPAPEEVRRGWEDLKQEAQVQGISVFQLSALLSLSALRKFTRGLQVASLRTGRFFAGALLDHYSETLKEIHHTGYLTYWVREFRPYVRAAAGHFSPRRRSFTQRVLWKKG